MSKQSEEQQNSSQASAEMYSLSSILSDYKAGAIVRNERKTSKRELEHKAEEIIAEMRREQEGTQKAPPEAESDTKQNADMSTEAEPVQEGDEVSEPSEEAEPHVSEPITIDPEYGTQSALPELKPLKTKWLQRQEKKRQRAIARYDKKRAAQLAAAAEDTIQEEPPEPKPDYETLFAEPETAEQTAQPEEIEQAADQPDEAEQKDQPEKMEEHPPVQEPKQRERPKKPEPTRGETLASVTNKLKSLRTRLPFAMLFCILMAVLTMLPADSGINVTIGGGITLLPVMIAVLQVGVILLGLDILAKGIVDLLAVRPGFESLVTVANLAAIGDAALMLTGRSQGGSMPYCACGAAVLAFTMWGARMRNSAYRETLKTMGLASVPTVVTAEDGLVEGGTVLTKKLDSSKGFIRRLLKTDMPEKLYHKTMPYLLILLLILAAAAAYLSGSGAFLHSLAALCCAAAGLTAPMVFPRPFSALARKLCGNGAAVAGWSGAVEMEKAQGIIIRDLDVFPENCIYQNAMRVLSGALADRVVAYTGSVMIAAGSGLKRAFGDLMRQYNAPLYHVEDFDCGTEGGISAFIGKEQVLVGTRAYMNLLGIRVPNGVDKVDAVYTAIDNELCGVFVIQYTPSTMVQNALLRLEDSRMRPIFAIRDFNINPAMMQQKFRIDAAISFLPVENRYLLSRELDTHHAPVALLSRDGLWHYSETARGSRRMVHMVRRALGMTLLGAVLGVLIVFIAFSKGAFAAASPIKLLASMLLWAFATMLIGDCAEGK